MGIKDIFKKIDKEKKLIEGEEKKDKFFSSQKDFANEEAARAEFERSKKKLFDINRWTDLPGITSAFQLYSATGELKKEDRPQIGDFVHIELPGPFPENWVKVLAVKEDKDFAEFVVTPSSHPTARGIEAKETEHFFTDEATSTFRVKRKGKTIFGYEIGQDERINNQGREAANREIVNTVIAQGGWLAFQKIQWEKFADYVVHNIEIEDE